MSEQIRDQLQATLGGAYTLERELGGGGMSRVFVAEETALRQAGAVDSAAGRAVSLVFAAATTRDAKIDAGLPFGSDLTAFDGGVDKMQMEKPPVSDRPYLYSAEMNAKAGRLDGAPALIAQHEAVARDTAYGVYRRTPAGSRPRQGPDVLPGATLTETMAKIYDAKSDAENAARLYGEFIELWKNADPELQPRVAAARERLKKLTPVERPMPD